MAEYSIAKRNAYCPDVIEGVIAYDNGIRYSEYEVQLNDSWERIRPLSSSKVIALFIDELDALFEISTIEEMRAEDRFAGVLTFGVHPANKAASQPVGTSHLDIIANELHIPLLQLERPAELQRIENWKEWIFNNPLASFFDQQVKIDLSTESALIDFV
ncbi:hypothetical protein IPO96_02765 [Candidatus Saccharibacteria bacterium]|nr:MAG: hypothetical protein IPO96_02765 [Candidatus Saccharibacteria bacterium]